MTRHFLILYRQTGSADMREQKRGEHIAYRKGLGNALSLAGPLLDDDGQPDGSVIIIAAGSREEAEEIASSDPFVLAGLLAIEAIRPMRIAAMVPPG